jgi:DNA invertase Pin-like site-specific DNA recombinase
LTAHFGKFVAYYRVSTDKQGQSGLGLDAQRQAVMNYLNGGPWKLIAEHTEVETGKRADRPELQKALAACRKHKGKLIIAKLDRLSRNLAFIATLMDSNVEFIAADSPHANRLTVHILAAVAEHERGAISERTKAALAAAKRRGVKLGGPRLAVARKASIKARSEAADAFAANVHRQGNPGQRTQQPPWSRTGPNGSRCADRSRWLLERRDGGRCPAAPGRVNCNSRCPTVFNFACCSVLFRPDSSRRASQPKPTGCLPAANG